MPQRLPLEDLIAFLVDAPLFEHLDEVELSEIVGMLEVCRVSEGAHVFRVGQEADAWYVVYAGAVEVVYRGSEVTRVLSHLGPRGCFGEMATLDGAPRSASVRAVADATLLRVPRAAFNAALRSGNLAAYKIVHRMALLLIARLRGVNAALAAEPLGRVVPETLEPTEQ